MKKLTTIAAGLSLLALTACGPEETTEQAQTEATDAAASTMEAVTEALKLDTSSLEAFAASLDAMKASLSEEDQAKLMAALGQLAGSGEAEATDMMDAAKDMAEGKSMTETLYEKLGDKLSGMSFEDILNMAG